MREIKFRAWDPQKKRMCNDLQVDYEDGVFNNAYYPGGESFGDNPVMMQFTGLKDKNGKEIYEGDIFDCIYKRDGCKHKSMIVWGISDASFRVRRCGECDQPNVIQTMSDIQRKEVIGNIYENPELMKGRG